MLTGIHIRHYALLQDTCAGLTWDDATGRQRQNSQPWILQPLTVLVGRNSTGKTSFLDALSFVSDCLRYDVQMASVLDERGGFSRLVSADSDHSVSFELIFSEDKPVLHHLLYRFECACDQHGRPYVASEEVRRFDQDGPQPGERRLLQMAKGEGVVFDDRLNSEITVTAADLKHPALAVWGMTGTSSSLTRLYRQISRWFFSVSAHAAGRPDQRAPGGHKHISPGLDNIENVLAYYREEQPDIYQRMIRKISDRLPTDRTADREFLSGKMTSGVLKLFALLLLLEDPDPRPLLCLEEPDVGLYHEMVDLLGREMRDYSLRSDDCQIIFTTHSPFMLESMKPDEVWVFSRVRLEADQPGPLISARARCAASDPLVQAMYRQGIGLSAIWYGGHFDQEAES